MAYSKYRCNSGVSPRLSVHLEKSHSMGANNGRPNGNTTTLISPTPTRSKFMSSSLSGHKRYGSGPSKSSKDDSGVPGRVRVAVRLRPQNADEMISDADFGDFVELQPEMKRLKLRKNNWDCETFQFDGILTGTASQKRVYELVAKPVVKSVLEGYNGTVMAYGQTGTGKTYTLANLEEGDPAKRGIMVRAMEDILADVSDEQDSVSISFLQVYMEQLQDLLAPEKGNISIVEDSKTGDISVPGATVVEVRDQKSFVDLLRLGEANRFAANTSLNTESSRSHAILLINVKKTLKAKQERELTALNENGINGQLGKAQRIPIIRKSKLLIVDLAGSERIDKSGSEGQLLEEAKFINLSLTSLGKCINALAENSSHVPIRDSKLTRLLRDSFGGTARTSLIITIGPSPQYWAETASTIMFGQRAMKIENMMKIKEEVDYKSLCQKLEAELDQHIAENERQAKRITATEEETERNLEAARNSVMEAERKLATSLEEMTADKLGVQKKHMETIHKLEQERTLREKVEKELRHWTQNLQIQKEKQMQSEHSRNQQEVENLRKKHLEELAELGVKLDAEQSYRGLLEKRLQEAIENHATVKDKHNVGEQEAVLEVKRQVQDEWKFRKQVEPEVKDFNFKSSKWNDDETEMKMRELEHKLEEQAKQKQRLEEEVSNLKQQLLQLHHEPDEIRKNLGMDCNPGRSRNGNESPRSPQKSGHTRDSIDVQRTTIAKLFEQVGLQKILSLLQSEDIDVRVHAVKVVANLAAEESNQERIVKSGGLGSLLALLKNSEDETICRVAAGAIANLAMNESNQDLIMSQGGIKLLVRTANEAQDPQTLRMVAGAIANLCGNDKLQGKLREEGGVKALLGMVRSNHPDVLAQVARGIANFAKCESRGVTQGHKTRRSWLIDDGALPWIVANANNEASPIRRHIELALCHLAQHDLNTKDLITSGALLELVQVSKECSREDIRDLAKRTLQGSQTFQRELQRMRVTR